MPTTFLGNIKGPTGAQGKQGDRGLPGIDALPAAEAVAEYARTASPLKTILDRDYRFRQRLDAAGETFAAKLDMGGGGDVVLAVIGDSTGDENTEWVRRWTEEIAAARPKLLVEYFGWSYTGENYKPVEIIQPGEGYVPGGDRITVSDDFNRASASTIVGAAPQRGTAWYGTGSAFSLSGTAAVATGSTTGGTALSDGGAAGDGTVTAVGVKIDTTPAAGPRVLQIYNKYVNASNQLYVFLSVTAAGAATWGIQKRISGTATTIASGPVLGLPANTASTFNVTIALNGTTVTATANGLTVTAALTAADLTALAASTVSGFGTFGGAADAGTAIDAFQYRVTTTATANGQKLTVYNGSVPGKQLGFQLPRLSDFMPVRPDLLFVSSSHNYGAMMGPAYMQIVTQFIGSVRALYADLPIVLCSQNPQFPGAAAYPASHLSRMLALRIYALLNGFGYLPVIEAFLGQPDGGRSRVLADGIHPNQDGSALWHAVASDYLASKSLLRRS